ncbi:MAG TPA: DNA/RNA non-specific endonuclease [Thermoanaerobaculia bacterium]|nr:DNA/RNA non-specific endonuclease [Thermoanaerobaculia bacterium]
MSSSPPKRTRLNPCLTCNTTFNVGFCPFCTGGTFCNAHLGAHLRTCGCCGLGFCASVVHALDQTDAANHPCCARSLEQCPHCLSGGRYCRTHSLDAHIAVADVDLHDCCAASLRTCPHCTGAFCQVHSLIPHESAAKDAANEVCCTASLQECDHCKQEFCGAHSYGPHRLLNGSHTFCAAKAATCKHCKLVYCSVHETHAELTADCDSSHKSCAVAAVACTECNELFCRACQRDKTRRTLCVVCLKKSRKSGLVKLSIHAEDERVPGTDDRRRQTWLAGPLKSSSSKGRATPPPPLSSGKTEKEDIEELKQFDRGHLLALELGGVDHSSNIAPMIREFNQSGKWRQMEIALGGLLGKQSLYDVDGGEISATDVEKKIATFTLRSPLTVNVVSWIFEVRLFYDDLVGDSRIPVWFYVRLLRGDKVAAHFSFANRCGKTATMPDASDQLEFIAADDLYRKLSKEQRDKLVWEAMRDDYRDAGDPSRPNQLLQFMHDVNFLCREKGLELVFERMQVEAQKGSTAYTDFQRAILRKFNRWKNAGKFLSDAQKGAFEGEEADVHQTLDECGGRSAPEVDHIDPSYTSGANSYMNARLVSAQHNHLYREKKESGAKSLDRLLHDLWLAGELAFWYEDDARTVTGKTTFTALRSKYMVHDQEVFESGKVAEFLQKYFADDVVFDSKLNLNIKNSNWPYEPFRGDDLVAKRQTFLKAERSRLEKYQKEKNLNAAYVTSRQALEKGVQTFIDDKDHPERKELMLLLADTKKKLCWPSDVLKTDGGETAAVDSSMFEALAPEDARKDEAYRKLMERWKKYSEG